MGGRGGSGRSAAASHTPVAAIPESVDPTAYAVELIRQAYDEQARQPGAWVSVADIRDALPQSIDRRYVDAAFRRVEQHPDANIVPESNQKNLSERERRGAVVIGDQQKHFIALRLPH